MARNGSRRDKHMKDLQTEDASKIQEFLRITFETMDQGITIYDRDLRLVAWNNRYAGMGITPPEFLHFGANLLDLYEHIASKGVFGQGDPAVLARQHIDTIRNGPLIHTEVLTPPTGRSVLIHRFRLPNGGICATFNDVTEELRAEAELRQAQKMDAIGELTGGVAHDINNVLAIIDGNLELALENGMDRDSLRLIRSALDASERGAKLTHRLLAFARRQPLQPTLTNPGALLSGLGDMLRKMLGESIEVEILKDEGLWLCNVDRNQLENVVLNLAVNARDSMPSGGKLTLKAANVEMGEECSGSPEFEAGQYAFLSASDTGSGMDSETVDRAFEPFFTTKPLGRGTGLGLSMAHGFVKQSGGHIRIQSEVDQGTTVEIYLPRVNEEAGLPVTELPLAPRSHDVSGTIVVVEDDEDLRPLVVSQLESLGYGVRSARQGAEALKILHETGEVDLLLADVILPDGMSGFQLAELARALDPGLGVVFMSGYPEKTVFQQVGGDTDVELLQKPFRRADLARAVQRGIDKRKGARPRPSATPKGLAQAPGTLDR